MDLLTLVKRSLFYFWRTNLAVILGVATAVAVLAGALLVGDSVRASLRDLALARLGKTDYVISGQQAFFRENLAVDLQRHDQFGGSFNSAVALIALEGVVTRDENNARAGGVQVYGVDEKFWKFHGSQIASPEDNDALASQALAQELGAKPGETIILRIEKPTATPVESLHGRKDDLGRTVRFTLREILPAASIGEFSLRPQQGAVRSIFVPLKKLQRNLEQGDKANVVLLSAKSVNEQTVKLAETILRDKFELADLGLKLRAFERQNSISLETDSGVLSDAIAGKAIESANGLQFKTSSFLTYLANEIRYGEKTIPYSLVTAVDAESYAGLLDGATAPAAENQIIINDWTARDLGAKAGDNLTLEFYVWRDEGRLDTDRAEFQIAGVTKMEGLAADRDLAPEYPGITEARSLSDWDPPFPIDLSRVRKSDEEYWDKFRTTPKAFIPLAAGQRLWSTRYGKLTSIRATPAGSADLQTAKEAFEKSLKAAIDPVQMGLGLQPVKEQSLQASQGATDFGQYFAYFSFFLVISALLLTTLFFKLGIEQRLREIGLLRAIGFSPGRIRSLFLREGAALALIGSLLGIIGAILYGALMMYGLRNWWIGAVGTTLLRLHVSPPTLAIGSLAGIAAALLCVWWTLRGLRSATPRGLLAGEAISDRRSAVGGKTGRARLSSGSLSVFFGMLGLALLIAAALKAIGQVGGFFGAGASLLIAILFFWAAWLRSDRRQTIQGQGFWPMLRMGFRNASTNPGRSVLCIALIASAAFIIVSVEAFRRDAGSQILDKKSGNGGYPLMAESLLPIVRDLNGAQGREELNLTDEVLTDAKIARFRLRPGDDASCLNLYQPENPRILGASEDFINSNRFAFQSSITEIENPWLLLNADSQSAIPVIADANSMTYVLHAKLGDEIAVDASDGTPVKLKLVAALADSIFQSELLMSEKNFLKYFPDQEGHRVFLIDAPVEKSAAVAAALEDKLSDFGFDAIDTHEKLASFHQVENTYLSTFQTLGGLGLLLGTLGLATVLLRNVLERRKELALMRAIGYRPSHLSLMVIAENALMLGCGLLTGVFCALLAIAPAFIARGGRFSTVSLGLLLLAVLATGLAASLLAVRAAIKSPLLNSLRAE